MRFLAANRSESPVLESSANVMRAITFVAKIDRQFRGHFGQIEISRAHHLQNRWTHETQERDECGDWIARQTKHCAVSRVTEEKRFPRFDRDSPDVDLCAERTQCRLDQIMFAHRYAAANNKHRVLDCLFQSFPQ